MVRSVRFTTPRGSDALRLRDPKTNRLICLRPEWIRGERNVPAAFVRGTIPAFDVEFERTPGSARGELTGPLRIGAQDARGRTVVVPRRVYLRFDGHHRSQAVRFRLAAALPDAIGTSRAAWRWYAETDAGRRISLGRTSHTIYTTWEAPGDPSVWQNLKPPVDPAAWSGPQPWIYLPIVQWACAWAAGKKTEKAICDAIIARFHESGLKYAVGYHSVREVLLHGGGYCGGFYLLFQALAGSQGVPVERRSMLVDWRPMRGERAMWCAIVVTSPGTNLKRPAEGTSVFHDADRAPQQRQRVRRIKERRYRFWGSPDGHHDGHCLNFLQYRARWYLYDLSFFNHSVPLDWKRLPTVNLARSVDVARLGNFRTAYLESAVPFMLGSLDCDGRMYRTSVALVPETLGGPPMTHTDNGLSARTRAIPDRGRAITFYWGP